MPRSKRMRRVNFANSALIAFTSRWLSRLSFPMRARRGFPITRSNLEFHSSEMAGFGEVFVRLAEHSDRDGREIKVAPVDLQLKLAAARLFPFFQDGPGVQKHLAVRSVGVGFVYGFWLGSKGKQVPVEGFVQPATCGNTISDDIETLSRRIVLRANHRKVAREHYATVPEESKEKRTAEHRKLVQGFNAELFEHQPCTMPPSDPELSGIRRQTFGAGRPA